jgi:hypothetical protein
LKVRPVLRRYTISNKKLTASVTPRAIADVGAVAIMWYTRTTKRERHVTADATIGHAFAPVCFRILM